MILGEQRKAGAGCLLQRVARTHGRPPHRCPLSADARRRCVTSPTTVVGIRADADRSIELGLGSPANAVLRPVCYAPRLGDTTRLQGRGFEHTRIYRPPMLWRNPGDVRVCNASALPDKKPPGSGMPKPRADSEMWWHPPDCQPKARNRAPSIDSPSTLVPRSGNRALSMLPDKLQMYP